MTRRHLTFLAGIAVALSVLLALGGVQAAQALWRTSATATGTVSTGTVRISVSGFDALKGNLSPTTPSVAGRVTITNQGTLPVTSISASSSASGSGTDAVAVAVWLVTDQSSTCTTVPTGAARGSWTTVQWPTVTTTLPVGSTATYCVRASIASTAAAASLTASAIFSARDASWPAAPITSSASQTVTTTMTVPTGGAAITPDDRTAISSVSYSVTPAQGAYRFCVDVVVTGAKSNGASNWAFMVDTTKSPYNTMVRSSWTATDASVTTSWSGDVLKAEGASGSQTTKDSVEVTLCAVPAA